MSPEERRERWQNLEKETASLLSGKITPGSGSKSIKGDVRAGRGPTPGDIDITAFLVECKFRNESDDKGAFITIDVGWIETIYIQAKQEHRLPLLVVEISTRERAGFIPLEIYQELEIGTNPPFGVVKSNRSFRFTPGIGPRMVVLDKIRIPDKHWVVLSWQELRELGQVLRAQQKTQEVARGKLVPKGKGKRKLNSRGFGGRSNGLQQLEHRKGRS